MLELANLLLGLTEVQFDAALPPILNALEAQGCALEPHSRMGVTFCEKNRVVATKRGRRVVYWNMCQMITGAGLYIYIYAYVYIYIYIYIYFYTEKAANAAFVWSQKDGTRAALHLAFVLALNRSNCFCH